MTDLFHQFIFSLIAMFSQPESRFFLPYLASAVLFAWGVCWFQTRGEKSGAALAQAIGPKILLHRSPLAGDSVCAACACVGLGAADIQSNRLPKSDCGAHAAGGSESK